jgi:hypothetical protein
MPSPAGATATLAGENLALPMRASSSRLDWAQSADADGIAALLAQPLPGAIRIALQPDAARCIPRADADVRHHAMVIRGDHGRILAHGSRSVRRLWLGGRPRWVGYLGGLRRDETLAGGGRRLALGLARLAQTRADDEADHDLTSILSANQRARRVLEGGLPGSPSYHHLGDYRTLVFRPRALADVSLPPGWSLGPLRRDETAAVQDLVDKNALDYAPVVTVADAPADWSVLRHGDAVVGAARLWDRRSEQRVLVDGYAPALRTLRGAANLLLHASGRPTLPPAGTVLQLAHAAHLTCPAQPFAPRALLAAIARQAETRGCALLAIGLGRHHPCLRLLENLPAWRLDSRLYAVGVRPILGVTGAHPEAALL